MTARGAMGANREGSGFSLAHQQLGDLYVRAGIIRRKPELIKRGFQAFDYAFDRQRRDGSLPEQQTEGYAFFVEAVAHSAVLVQATRYSSRFRQRIKGYGRRLERAARHMVTRSAWAQFKERNRSYTHSGYSVGTALGLTGKLVGSSRLKRFGRRAVAEALDNQRENGVNPELGGYDVRYQMAGIAYAERYRVYFPGGRLQRQLERMVDRGLGWMSPRVGPEGYIDWAGSTRTCKELSSIGSPKSPGYHHAVRGFAYWGALEGRSDSVATAERAQEYFERVGPGALCERRARSSEAQHGTAAQSDRGVRFSDLYE